MNLPELLAPAGSPESVRAAVQSGAGAVYMGFGTFNARRGAQNFSREEMAEAISYCRVRGVKTNITLNILVADREMRQALDDARFLYEAGADALIVQDLGLARLLRRHAPDFALHASTQMTIHSLAGAVQAKELGFSRVVLSRELSLENVRYITANAGVETEIFVHGALCMCYSGQCYLSALIGQRSGNRGLCAQPCRLPYDGGYPLSLKDLALAGHIPELIASGVSSLKIEGRMKKPEYTAIVTGIYADLVRENRKPTPQERDALRRVFSRDGFTDGYLTGQKGDAMFGVKTDVPLDEVRDLYDAAKHRFAPGQEAPLVPVEMRFSAKENGLQLIVSDESHFAQADDAAPVEPARTKPLSAETAEASLRKTGGTPFSVRAVHCEIEEGRMVSAARMNALRRQVLEQLLRLRRLPPEVRWQQQAAPPQPKDAPCPHGWTASVRTMEQAAAIAKLGLDTIYAPLSVCAEHTGLPLAAILPRVYTDHERETIAEQMERAKQHGVSTVLAGNLGQIAPARALGFSVFGDFGLNLFNSDAVCAAAELGLNRVTVSFESRLAQIRDLAKPVPCEMLVYGRLPLMIFENCAIRRAHHGTCVCKEKQTALTDRRGQRFPLLPEFGCRNTLCNSVPLWVREDFFAAGIGWGRLHFTTETPEECAAIARAFLSGETLPGDYTGGLYHRGVE